MTPIIYIYRSGLIKEVSKTNIKPLNKTEFDKCDIGIEITSNGKANIVKNRFLKTNKEFCYECLADLDENGRCPTKMCKGY